MFTDSPGRRRFLQTFSSGAPFAVSSEIGQMVTTKSGDIRISGDWAVSLDRTDEGIAQRWFEWSLRATLPASGLGDAVSMATSRTALFREKSFFSSP